MEHTTHTQRNALRAPSALRALYVWALTGRDLIVSKLCNAGML